MTAREADEEVIDNGRIEEEKMNGDQEKVDHEEGEPGNLVSPPRKATMSRQITRDLPAVGSILERQMSVSGASVHGGG